MKKILNFTDADQFSPSITSQELTIESAQYAGSSKSVSSLPTSPPLAPRKPSRRPARGKRFACSTEAAKYRNSQSLTPLLSPTTLGHRNTFSGQRLNGQEVEPIWRYYDQGVTGSR
ncbi:hypothetical protein BaRGS_00027751 [Batillaria attramentaria]|uniref:Uncharacterized protein n=1 Tax=Batillaria attramentaria TaxID=370345 RepID=A0ABD0K1S1_9CAEN